MYKDMSVKVTAPGFKDLSDAFSYVVSQTDNHVLKEEDIKYWGEALKGIQPRPLHHEYKPSPISIDWSDLKLSDPPLDWYDVSKEIMSYTFPPQSNIYRIDKDTYRIDITYDRANDRLDIGIVFNTNGNTIEYNHIAKEHLEILFDINNLLYAVDNQILCTQCGKVIIDNHIVYKHDMNCIANILDDLEYHWNTIKRIR